MQACAGLPAAWKRPVQHWKQRTNVAFSFKGGSTRLGLSLFGQRKSEDEDENEEDELGPTTAWTSGYHPGIGRPSVFCILAGWPRCSHVQYLHRTLDAKARSPSPRAIKRSHTGPHDFWTFWARWSKFKLIQILSVHRKWCFLLTAVNGLNLDQFLNWIIGSAGLPDPFSELSHILNGKQW